MKFYCLFLVLAACSGDVQETLEKQVDAVITEEASVSLPPSDGQKGYPCIPARQHKVNLPDGGTSTITIPSECPPIPEWKSPATDGPGFNIPKLPVIIDKPPSPPINPPEPG